MNKKGIGSVVQILVAVAIMSSMVAVGMGGYAVTQVGEAGEQGPQGIQGETGPQGEQGPMGPQGSPGVNGSDGLIGPEGPMGPQGAESPIGSLYIFKINYNNSSNITSVDALDSGWSVSYSGNNVTATHNLGLPVKIVIIRGWRPADSTWHYLLPTSTMELIVDNSYTYVKLNGAGATSVGTVGNDSAAYALVYCYF